MKKKNVIGVKYLSLNELVAEIMAKPLTKTKFELLLKADLSSIEFNHKTDEILEIILLVETSTK